MKTTMRSHSKQKGFTLLEALVAFLILSVGMLGIASLQVVSLKAGKTAVIRTVAVIKVEEIMERIRNNPLAVVLYNVGTGSGADNGCNDYDGSAGKSCSRAQLAQDDIYFWKQGLTEALPGAGTTARIDVLLPAAGSQTADVTVTINWKERDPEADAMIDMNYSSTAQICNVTTC